MPCGPLETARAWHGRFYFFKIFTATGDHIWRNPGSESQLHVKPRYSLCAPHLPKPLRTSGSLGARKASTTLFIHVLFFSQQQPQGQNTPWPCTPSLPSQHRTSPVHKADGEAFSPFNSVKAASFLVVGVGGAPESLPLGELLAREGALPLSQH